MAYIKADCGQLRLTGNFKRDLLFCCSSKHSITHSSRSQYVSFTAYQGCLPSCELHSRSLAVERTVACDLEIAHPRFTQSQDCAHVLRNLEIVHKCYATPRLPAQSRDSENEQRNLEIARNIYILPLFNVSMIIVYLVYTPIVFP